MSITQRVCVWEYVCVFAALGIQHAKHMRHIVICSLPTALQYFSTFPHKWHDDLLAGKKSYCTKCFFFIFSTFV
jgi:hypothetical protein